MTDEEEKPWLEEVPVEKEGDRPFTKYRPQLIVAGAVVVVAFLGLVFYAYQSGENSTPAEVPLVRGPESAAKEKPEEPGGMVVPGRDKQVYNQVSGDKEDESGVTLGAGPELPEAPPAAKAEGAAASEEAKAPAEAQETPAKPQAETAPAPTPASGAEPKAATPAAAEGNFMIQLGAYGSPDSAERTWKALQGKYPAVLGALTPDYEPLKRAGGTLYRLRAGYFADHDGAEKACTRLKGQGQDCFPAKR